jgi:hypothetical protein
VGRESVGEGKGWVVVCEVVLTAPRIPHASSDSVRVGFGGRDPDSAPMYR